MNSISKLLLSCLLLPVAASGQTTTEWTSTTTSVWGTAGNWSNGVPGNDDTLRLGNTSTQTLSLGGNRTIANLSMTRTSGAAAIINTSGGSNDLAITGNLSTNLNNVLLQIRSSSSGALNLSITKNLDINSSVDFGAIGVATTNTASAIGSVAVSGTTNLNAGSLSVVRHTGSVNLGNLVMASGTLNLTAGSGSNGSDKDVENEVTVASLSGSTGVIHANKAETRGALTVNGSASSLYSSTISNGLGTVRLTKAGTGTLSLSGSNSYSGATAVNGGTLLLTGSGSINSTSGIAIAGGKLASNSSVGLTRNVTLNTGSFFYNSSGNYSGALTFTAGTLGGTNWNGTLGGLSIGAGQHISPGNSPGTATTTAQTWNAGGNYDWEIHDATGVAGTGFDTILITGALNLTNLSEGARFNLNLWSLSDGVGNVSGDALNFDPSQTYSWEIVQASSITLSGEVDINDLFNINLSAVPGFTGGFTNANTGSWSISQGGLGNGSLFLNYTAVPEPSTVAIFSGGLLFLALRKVRARRFTSPV